MDDWTVFKEVKDFIGLDCNDHYIIVLIVYHFIIHKYGQLQMCC